MIIEVYRPHWQATWDSFVTNSKNGTFLFYRNYMDYHSDRFIDHSLIVWDDGGHIVALLPANNVDGRIESHGGLTYGGFITDYTMTAPKMLEVFDAVCQYARDAGFSRWIYKPIPHIYHDVPAEEDLYSLYRLGAKVYRRDVLTVIDYRNDLAFQTRRIRSIRKARGDGIEPRVSVGYIPFWNILTSNLQSRYGLTPVHTVEEIEMLASRFPDEIQLYCSYSPAGAMLAGAVVYISRNVAHIQYNAASADGKQCGALDVVLAHLVDQYLPTRQSARRYLDFGISTEDNGHYLNVGLVDYKEGFGGRTVVHDLYEMDL